MAVASEGIGVERDAEPRRIGDWEVAAAAAIDWRFTTGDARIKLTGLYPAVHA